MSAGLDSPRVRSRQSARRNAPISCEVVRDEGFVLLSRTVLDLSDTGMRVSLASEGMLTKVSIGDLLWVSFRADHVGLWFDFEAEVARVSKGRRPQDDGASFGVRFLTRWDAGPSSAPALSRLLLRNGIFKMKKLVAPPALRGKRTAAAPRIVDVNARPNPDALLRACFP